MVGHRVVGVCGIWGMSTGVTAPLRQRRRRLRAGVECALLGIRREDSSEIFTPDASDQLDSGAPPSGTDSPLRSSTR
jgi:hypothetical protein